MVNPWELYDQLLEQARLAAGEALVAEVIMGPVWTVVRTDDGGMGLAMSPATATRTLPWSGTLRGRPIVELIEWVKSWNFHEAAVGMAALNAALGIPMDWAREATPLMTPGSANLAVFDHFRHHLVDKKVVVVGRYPGLERFTENHNWHVLEREPNAADLPDTACEYVLPQADWVFLTASALVNKSLPRLLTLSRHAVTVLMGPTLPWWRDWCHYGVDFLAGVRIADDKSVRHTAAEGGGVRIFEKGARYHLVDVGQGAMATLKEEIAQRYQHRDQLKQAMEQWYAGPGPKGRFPQWQALQQMDSELSELDRRYKRQWDARHLSHPPARHS
ncbi:conserved hypothetical protein [Magnetococcus marinus MC-1]|uniref:Heavy-metal chelation domain-containing protein n=1 Tax=Magnetococcus marinus (strain ATCC BAA-1437 / JCM 17883 / MC-1) TaxID=156889 RepID=A0L6V0_MAGMM|nr:DUF364 domain-containing protein [Magnetococcus marinus]ABK43693.1 conserved hypothetical protein [Magnetococcus marinus MC-1]